MESLNRVQTAVQTLKIMVVGNNPIDLSKMLTRIQKINDKIVVTEIAFDAQSLLLRLGTFKPDYILLDDNIERGELKAIIKLLHTERETRGIPITIVKNSNYSEAVGNGVMDYVLKETLTGDSLYRILVNSLKFRKTQTFLYQAYNSRKGQLMRFLRREPAIQI
jgi:response regulator of citrate/malate metabolism